jgi:hypothetical protein
LSDIKDFRPLEGQECTTRIVIRARCNDDDEDGDELEWLARNKPAPTQGSEYPSIRAYGIGYTLRSSLETRETPDPFLWSRSASTEHRVQLEQHGANGDGQRTSLCGCGDDESNERDPQTAKRANGAAPDAQHVHRVNDRMIFGCLATTTRPRAWLCSRFFEFWSLPRSFAFFSPQGRSTPSHMEDHPPHRPKYRDIWSHPLPVHVIDPPQQRRVGENSSSIP